VSQSFIIKVHDVTKRKLQFSQIQSPSQIGFHGLSKEFENLLLSHQKCQKINKDIFVRKFFNILRFLYI
jgi:hypothetical protein